jgi:hypothetical protein
VIVLAKPVYILAIKFPKEMEAELKALAAQKGLSPTAYGKMLFYEKLNKAA